jgi:tetratricopeptide (TPR) repeat protein
MFTKKIVLGFKIIVRLITHSGSSYFSNVEKVCLEQLEKNPDDSYIKWFLSINYLNNKKLDEAQILLESLVNQRPGERGVVLLLSRTYFKSQQYKKVVELLDDYAKLSDSDPHNYYLGYSFMQLKKFKKAINYLEKYVKYHPKDYVGFVRLGYAYYMEKMYELSLETYQKAEELNPEEQEIKNSIELCSDMLKRDKTLQ